MIVIPAGLDDSADIIIPLHPNAARQSPTRQVNPCPSQSVRIWKLGLGKTATTAITWHFINTGISIAY